MPQSQVYGQNWNNHLYSSPSKWGYNALEPNCQPPFQQSSSYTHFSEQLTEEQILEELERRIKKLEDATYQTQDSYSSFQAPPQQEEHTDLEKSMESMIQFQSYPFDMIEVRLSRLENMRRNEEILPTQSLTIPDTSSHIDENKES